MNESELSTLDSPLQYAVPAPSYGSRVWAGAAIVGAGLGLAVVGGCFLIGVMLISNHGFNAVMAATRLSASAIFLVIALYALAATAFFFAALVLWVGLRGLFNVIRS